LISQAIVVGDNKPFIAALITLDPEGLVGWLTMRGRPQISVAEALDDAEIRASIEKAIERANEAVSRAESIRKWELLPGDLTIENGYLTPSMKVKRAEVLRDYAAEIEELYNDTRDQSASSFVAAEATPANQTAAYVPVA
jgi:long-chain acyl-CoA synthetase